jgi:hypothetical protein
MHSWLWVKRRLCQYEFIMGTRRPSKATRTQPYQTTVSIERLPCLRIDATSCHEACQKKNSNYLSKDGKLDLHFRLLKRFHWNCHVNQRATWQSISKSTNANTKCYAYVNIYIHIYTCRLGRGCIPRQYLYINIYMKYQLTQWISMFQAVIGQWILPFIY